MIYQLSEKGRKISWKFWRKIKGCGLSNENQGMVIRKISGRFTDEIPLGRIEDAWSAAGRELARFAKDHLKRDDWIVPYKN